MRRLIAVSGIVVALTFAYVPSVVSGQERLTQQCATVSTEQTRRFCNLVVEAIEIAQPHIGLALTGGNPVPGANSTLGMRVGSVPRISIGG
ncbi:MAG TPA: hypothetical protein VK864_02450, partial [Longimicrobiales bacterium]|nr:hypothetical protein [Longimicrobiales bacterium]